MRRQDRQSDHLSKAIPISVRSVAFSRDGKRIVSGSDDKTVRIWDASTGQPVGSPLEGHTIFCDVGCILSRWETNRVGVRRHDSANMGCVDRTASRITSRRPYRFCDVGCILPRWETSRVGSWDKTVRIWDASTGQPVGSPLEGHTYYVMSVAFSPDGKRIVSGSYDETVRIWDASTGQPVGSPLEGHTDSVMSVAFSPDGKRIVSGSGDKTVRIWDASTGQPIGSPLEGHTDSVCRLHSPQMGNESCRGQSTTPCEYGMRRPDSQSDHLSKAIPIL